MSSGSTTWQANTALLRSYVEYMQLVSDLRFGPTNDRIDATLAKLFGTDIGALSSSLPPVAQASSLPFAFSGNTFHGAVGYFCLGLAGGVSGGHGGFWDRAVDRLSHARVRPDANRQRSAATITLRSSNRRRNRWPDHRHGRLPVGSTFRNLRSKDPRPQDRKSIVSLGDTFVLASGLMEITYDTGAKVILQGPVTYEVESVAGGYLSVGKLTARMEKKINAERKRQGVRSPDLAQSSYSLFAIRTPTATVTDLGTEFGIEVDKEGTPRRTSSAGWSGCRWWPPTATHKARGKCCAKTSRYGWMPAKANARS